jgi:hypothetical protein
VTEERRHALPDRALPERRVAVAVRAEADLGVVDVQAAEPVEPDPLVEIVDSRVEGGAVGHVDARHPPVARIEADAEAGVCVEPVDDRRELVHRAADRASGAGGVLQHQPEAVVRQLQ